MDNIRDVLQEFVENNPFYLGLFKDKLKLIDKSKNAVVYIKRVVKDSTFLFTRADGSFFRNLLLVNDVKNIEIIENNNNRWKDLIIKINKKKFKLISYRIISSFNDDTRFNKDAPFLPIDYNGKFTEKPKHLEVPISEMGQFIEERCRFCGGNGTKKIKEEEYYDVDYRIPGDEDNRIYKKTKTRTVERNVTCDECKGRGKFLRYFTDLVPQYNSQSDEYYLEVQELLNRYKPKIDAFNNYITPLYKNLIYINDMINKMRAINTSN
ncbi:MAG: hypothetical protein QW597_01945 [Thermoplasmataceae archaeon]